MVQIETLDDDEEDDDDEESKGPAEATPEEVTPSPAPAAAAAGPQRTASDGMVQHEYEHSLLHSPQAGAAGAAAAAAAAPDPLVSYDLLRSDGHGHVDTIDELHANLLEQAAVQNRGVRSKRTWAADGFTYRGSLRGNKRHGLGQSTYDSGSVFVGEYRDDKCNGETAQLHIPRCGWSLKKSE